MATALSTWLGDNPQAVFQSQIMGLQPQMQRFLSGRYNDYYGRYMANQAMQARRGEMPRGDFAGFLGNIPWLQEYYSYAPYQRGYRPSTFSPPTRFMNY